MCRTRRNARSTRACWAIYSGVTYAGQNQVVSVNRGALDGLDVGSVLQLYIWARPSQTGRPKGMS